MSSYHKRDVEFFPAHTLKRVDRPGNSPYEVGIFKKTNQVPFPLFSDKDFAIHKAYGEVRTPYYIVVRINNDGTHQIVHAQLGGFQGAESFLQLVLRVSEL